MAGREHDQQVELPYPGAEGPQTVPQAETRGRRRHQSQSTTPDSRRPSTISGTHHYLPPTSSFSRSRSHRRAMNYPPYRNFDRRASRYVPLPSPTPYIPPVQVTYNSRPRPQFSEILPFIPPHSAHGIIQIPPDQRTYSTYFTSEWTRSSEDCSAAAESRSNLGHHAAVDTFRQTSSPSIIGCGLPLAHEYSDTAAPTMLYPLQRRRTLFEALDIDGLATFALFIFDTVPRQLYLHFLLRLPMFYFSRVARVFEEANMTMQEIKEMAVAHVDTGPVMLNWQSLVDSLLKEWETLNIVSALLLSYVLWSRWVAFLSDD